ncbi:hypothetical protein MYCTH_2303736 [Thermothelomyces thermophilus ATCC 42464]|uniref:Iron-sulfur cluster assembly factor IBA57 homolog, mitochondrial n=1 Tax=Thermothelomyces thermophilus (strain ATCC 42464 / BCRC 31852 / DSM 1799) TaxID=573729 RepID=G2QDJ6_THET4|nr:uncharacterized protein MYCTH_2303736 [Thermothelomyces thermophilus ATCC 42464]AEO57508.1 hypothetical protein MYCTH_2303736 [Thermothelomyces thermophilus ATCC 42464]
MRSSRTVLASAGAAAAAAAAVSHNPASRACRSCFTCLTRLPVHQRRAFSRSAPRHAAPSSPSPAGLVELTSRKLISVSGPDAAKYLQGVITANLTPGYAGSSPTSEHIRTDSGFYAAFLTAQGRILHDVFIYRDLRDTSHPPGHSWLVEVDAAEADRLQKHIKRYKLRAKFDIRVLDDGEGRVWHAWDDNSASPSPITTLTSSSSSSSPTTTIITAPDTRAPNLGHRILTFSPPSSSSSSSSSFSSSSSSPLPQIAADGRFPLLPEAAYTLRRYLHGVPEGQAELLHGQALPHESNLDLTGAVDFRKGCYVGQELTIRTEHRGVVRKRVLPCLLYPDHDGGGSAPEITTTTTTSSSAYYSFYRPEIAPGLSADMVPPEASIGRVGRKGRSAGKWLRGVGNVGLALCRLEIMTDVALPGETGGPAFAEAEDEFVVGLGGGDGSDGGDGGDGNETAAPKVRIKALVPDWLRKGLADKERH